MEISSPPRDDAPANAETRRPHPSEGLFLALAPMDGVTDHVFRGLLTDAFGGQSGISLCVSEFVRVTNQVVPAHVFLRHCPELARGGRTAAGVPVFVQLLGGRPDAMARAAADAADLGAPGIDLNFGCPAKTVNRHDGGASLLKAPCRVLEVTAAVREAVPAHIPVTAKIRVGWDSAAPVVELAEAAEAGGAAWLTIHARTRAQLYKPPVDYPALGRAREAVSIPVVANGDIFDPESFRRCHAESGCGAFMIGRGAMGHPDLFRRLRLAARGATTHDRDTNSDAPTLDVGARAQMLLEYADRMSRAGHGERAALGRLKQWLRLGAPLQEDYRRWFAQLKREQTLESVLGALRAEVSCPPSPRQTPRTARSEDGYRPLEHQAPPRI